MRSCPWRISIGCNEVRSANEDLIHRSRGPPSDRELAACLTPPLAAAVRSSVGKARSRLIAMSYVACIESRCFCRRASFLPSPLGKVSRPKGVTDEVLVERCAHNDHCNKVRSANEDLIHRSRGPPSPKGKARGRLIAMSYVVWHRIALFSP